VSYSFFLPVATISSSTVPVDDGTRDLFGYDILFKDGKLPLTTGGDYIRVGGKDNLRAVIYRRLITRPGEFRFRPSYGVGVQMYVKKAASTSTLDALQQRIIEQLTQDARITEVQVNAEMIDITGGQALRVHVQVSARGEKISFEPFTFSEEAAK